MTSKPNWACTSCGMSSSRKSSVKRHIEKIHNYQGVAIPFVEYLVGRSGGKYFPLKFNRRPKSQSPVVAKILEEIERDYARKVANAVNKPANDPEYLQIAFNFRNYIQHHDFKETLKDFKTGNWN